MDTATTHKRSNADLIYWGALRRRQIHTRSNLTIILYVSGQSAAALRMVLALPRVYVYIYIYFFHSFFSFETAGEMDYFKKIHL